MEVIQSTVGNGIQLVDSAFWTAKEALHIMRALGTEYPAPATPQGAGTEQQERQAPTRRAGQFTVEASDGFAASRFLVSDVTPNFEQVAETLLGAGLPSIEKVSVEELEEKDA
jgi:hypothetical protein